MLGELEQLVLLGVMRVGDNAYGVTIATRISERTGRDISIGAVYATLGRLSDKGFVTFSFSAPEPIRGGRARKLVALTAPGTRALQRTTSSFNKMLEGVVLRPATSDRR